MKVAFTGSIRPGTADTVWLDATLASGQTADANRMVSGQTIPLFKVEDDASLTLRNVPLRKQTTSSDYRVTLRGSQAAAAIANWSYRYVNRDLRMPPVNPQFDCSYTAGAITLEVTLSPPILGPP